MYSFFYFKDNERTANAKIRLRGCAVWSAHLLFAYNKNSLFQDVVLFNNLVLFCLQTCRVTRKSFKRTSFAFAQLRCGTTPRVLDVTFLLPFCATDVQAGWSIFLPNLDQNKIYVCFLFGCLFVCLDATSLVILIKALLKSEEFGRILGSNLCAAV